MQSSFQIFCIHFMKSFLEIFTFVTADFTLSKWLDFENLLISFEIIAICLQCNHHLRYSAFISWDHFWRFSRSWLQISLSRNDSILNICWYRSKSRSRSLQSVFNAIIISDILHSFHEIILEDLHVRDCKFHSLEMTRFWALVDIVRDLVRDHCNLSSMQSSSQIFCIHFMKSFLKIFTFVTANLILSKWLDSEHLLISFEISFEIIAICLQCNHHLRYSAFISWNHSRRSSRSWLHDLHSRNDSILSTCWYRSKSRSKTLQSAFYSIIISNILHPFHEIILEDFHTRLLQTSSSRNDSISKIYWSRSKSLQSAFYSVIFSNILHPFHEIILENLHTRLLQTSSSRNDSISKTYWFRSRSLQSAFYSVIFSNILHLFHEIILENLHTRLLQTSSSRNGSISKTYWFRSRSRSRSLQSAFYSITISDILHSFHEIIFEDFHVRDCKSHSLEMTRFWALVDIVRDFVRKHCNLSSMQSSSQIFCTHFMRSF